MTPRENDFIKPTAKAQVFTAFIDAIGRCGRPRSPLRPLRRSAVIVTLGTISLNWTAPRRSSSKNNEKIRRIGAHRWCEEVNVLLVMGAVAELSVDYSQWASLAGSLQGDATWSTDGGKTGAFALTTSEDPALLHDGDHYRFDLLSAGGDSLAAFDGSVGYVESFANGDSCDAFPSRETTIELP